jgi:CRP/FNR family cyclic AMP-dependent transcriptional regulator
MPTTVEMLAEVPLFALLDEQERALVAERMEVSTHPKGQILFTRGEPGGSLWVVRTGQVELFFKNDTGDRILLEVANPGDFFGEVSFLDGGSRTASALVTEDLEALVMERDDLEGFLKRSPAAAMDLLTATGRRLRETVGALSHTATRNVNVQVEDKRTRVMKAADWISAFSGSIPFLSIHCVLFAVWIGLNAGPLASCRAGGFDPYPFGLLTMVVSLEAIILSVFVLLSQNRQAERDRLRNDVEYDVNLKAELEVAHLHEKVDAMQAEILHRLATLQKTKDPATAAHNSGSLRTD